MNGLLGNSWDDPRTMATLALAQGLLGGGGSMQRLAGGLAGYQGTMARSKREEEDKQRRALQDQMARLQLQTVMGQQAQAKAAAERQQAIEGAYRGAFVSPAQQALAGGGGPTVANAQAMQGMTPKFDQQRLIQGLMQADPMAAAKLAQPKDTEIKEYREIRQPDGSVTVVGLTKDGKVVNTNATPFVKPELRDAGGYLGGFDPITGKFSRVADKTMSPDGKDASARGWANIGLTRRGQDMTDARARDLAELKRVEIEQAAQQKKDAAANKEVDGKRVVDEVAASLLSQYDLLDQNNGITNPDNGALSNLVAGVSSSPFGQATGRMFGTQNQSARNTIMQQRPALMQAIMRATGMSAKQLDSNAELKLMLSTATDPELDIAANRRALDMIVRLYGTGSASSSGPAVGTVKGGYRFKGGDPASPSSWEKM